MSDRFPPLNPRPLRPGGLDAAVLEGRRRQRRVALQGSLAVAAVAVAATTLLPGSPRDRRSLEVTDGRTTSSPSATAAPVNAASPAAIPPDTPVGIRSGHPMTSRPSSASSPSARPAAGGASPSRVPEDDEPLGVQETPRPDAGPWHQDMTASDEVGYECGAEAEGGWCRVLYVARDRPAEPATLTLSLCRPVGSAAGTLRFDTEQEADVVVSADEAGRRPVWRWSSGRTFGRDPHEVTVRPGTCRRWRTTWNLTDDAGRELPDATYFLWASSVAPGTPQPSEGTEILVP